MRGRTLKVSIPPLVLAILISGSLVSASLPFSFATNPQNLAPDMIILDILGVDVSQNVTYASAILDVVVTVNASWDVFDFSGYLVEAYYDDHLIGSQIRFILYKGQEIVDFNFAWNTSGVELGFHAVSAKAYGSYTDIYVDGFVQILPVGNVNTKKGYATIQEAINAASEGDTIFVRNGTYHENVLVTKTVTLLGEDKDSTFIQGYYVYEQGVVTIQATDVRVSGFTVKDGWCGIAVYSSGSVVTDNRMTNNRYQDGGGQITKSGRGIWISHTTNTTVAGNIMDSNDRGISLEYAGLNTVDSNIVVGSSGSLGCCARKF